MNTKEIITGLRYVATKRPLECILYVSAADALETLQNERVKAECRNQQLNTRPEPSRLEIAAMLLAGSYACPNIDPLEANIALKQADKLIATAREAK